MGPAGPAGPPGPAGPAGALNRSDASGVIGGSGSFVAFLPAGAAANGTLPAIACYVSLNGTTWLAVAQTTGTANWPSCGLGGIGTASPAIVLLGVPVGYRFYLIAVW